MKGVPGWIGRGVDVAWVVALALYALAGYRNVPFHGDESTLITMSRDYHTLFQAGDLDAVLYTAAPDDPAEQELRLLNGTVSKYLYGLAWDLAGLTVHDLNEQWLWDAPWDWNITDNHKPSDTLLYAARLASALLLAASAWVVFAIGWIVGRGRWAAYAASLVYVMTPVVLINGRRAMMEGALLLTETLVVLAGLLLLRALQRDRARGWHYAALGLAAGLALSSKHTTVIAVGIVFVMVAAGTFGAHGRAIRELPLRRHLLWVCGAGVLALAVFLLLNPAWWSDPLHMPGRVWDLRQGLIEGQKAGYGSYAGTMEHIEGLIRRVADGTPQYYEVDIWGCFIRDEISAYEAHPWTGVNGGVIGAFVRLVSVVLATGVLVNRWSDPAARLALAWFWVTALLLLVLTPFDWQRYYLPLQPALVVMVGVAAAWVGAEVQALRDRRARSANGAS